jgi:hypothetical protein
MKKLALFLILFVMEAALGQEVCCPGGESAAVGISFTSGGTPLLTGRFWLSSRSAMEVGLADPLNFNWFYVASLRVIHDYCALRPYLELAVDLPLKGGWWIGGWAGVGIEWCPAALENLSISIAGGLSLTYCLCCRDCWYCPWYYCWVRGTWFLFGIHYYLPSVGR